MRACGARAGKENSCEDYCSLCEVTQITHSHDRRHLLFLLTMRPNSVFMLLLVLCAACRGEGNEHANVQPIEVLSGRLGVTNVWENAEKTSLGERQFITNAAFDRSGGHSFPETYTFCGDLRKSLDRYWFKLVHIKYRQTSYGCDELVSIIGLKEPAKAKTNTPTTRVW